MMGSGCTKAEAGDVQRQPETVDGDSANATYSADSKKGVLLDNEVGYSITLLHNKHFPFGFNCNCTLA